MACAADDRRAAGTGASSATDTATAVDRAIPEEQKLVVYTAHKEEVYRPVIEEFEATTDIWVQVEAGGTTEMLRRIREEAEAKEVQADIMFGGGAENLETFKSYFAAYEPAREADLDPRFVSADHSWTPFTELPIVFIYNNKLVSDEEAPHSWREFLDGSWTGQISFADPEKSGTSITILETLRLVNRKQNWYTGDDADDRIIRDFAGNLDGALASGSGQVLTEVASGERMVGITLEETARKEMARGRDISMVYPQEGTSAVPDGVAIVKEAGHLANAQKFIDFVIDDPVQKYVETNLYRRSVRLDLETGMQKAEEEKTEEAAAENSGRITGSLYILDFDVSAASQEEGSVLEKFLGYLDRAQ